MKRETSSPFSGPEHLARVSPLKRFSKNLKNGGKTYVYIPNAFHPPSFPGPPSDPWQTGKTQSKKEVPKSITLSSESASSVLPYFRAAKQRSCPVVALMRLPYRVCKALARTHNQHSLFSPMSKYSCPIPRRDNAPMPSPPVPACTCRLRKQLRRQRA